MCGAIIRVDPYNIIIFTIIIDVVNIKLLSMPNAMLHILFVVALDMDFFLHIVHLIMIFTILEADE